MNTGRTTKRTLPMLPIKGWPALLLLTLALASCGKTTVEPMAGLWATDDKPYQDSTIEIGPDRIVFRDPLLAEPDACVLQRVRLKKKGPTSIVTLQYKNAEGVSFKRQIVYSARDGGSFWFRNQPSVVWTRVKRTVSADVQGTTNSPIRPEASE